ncbi:hypothetical protein [Polyangium aurulentum]|uniref:hypothetical protein n=1 Tax=Polyangium aurulentum TaxID=2567896 RepID=UPI0010AEA597|nr:hypothetical protein [Polyangium aurulentum]UQA59533.1 hypothetical protein E8A73_003195 [Polyangium aurulentum]
MNRWIGLLSLSLVALGYAGRAAAQSARAPAACRGDQEARAFNAGMAPGREIARAARAEARGCGDVARMAAAVTRGLRRQPLPRGAAPQALCRHAGMVEGVSAELGAIWEGCGAQCCERGELVAQIVGQLYCDVAIALGGVGVADYLPAELVHGCGAQFETCCDARLTDFARSHGGPEGQCLPYTEGAFLEGWTQARHNLCVYRVEGPPP